MKMSQLIRRWALALLLALPLAVPSAFSAQEGQPPGQSKRESKHYIVQMADAPVVAYNGGIAGLKATRPNRGKKIDPNEPRRGPLRRFPDREARRRAAARRWRPQGLQLQVLVQRFRRRTVGGAGRRAARHAGRAVGIQGRVPRRRYGHDAGVPRPQRRQRRLEQHRRHRRGRHHRHHRQRRLARAPELLRPHRHQRQWYAGRQAVLPADSRLARQVRPRRGL